MSTITSTGLGSGLDISSIVEALASVNDKQVDLLKTQAATTNAKLSSFGLLKSYMGNLRDIAGRLADTSYWNQTTASSSDSASVGVSSSTGAANASLSVQVSELAQSHIIASGAFAGGSSTKVGSGTLTIAFAGDSKSPLELKIASNTTLDGIKTQINDAKGGVTASIVKDANGARLVLRSDTGTDNELAVTVTDDDGDNTDAAGLSLLAYPPVLDADPDKAALQMKKTQDAKNAKATVNGLDIVSQSNTLTGVVDNVSITLNKTTTANVELKVGFDAATLKKAINDFASAYNDISKYISTQTKYDATTKKAAALQADRPTLTLQSNLRTLVTASSTASSTYTRLSDIGLEMQKDGTLKVNDTKLSKALNDNPAEVAKLFDATASTGAQGFGTSIKAAGDTLLDSDGVLASRTKSLQDSLKRNQTEQDKLAARREATKARLLKQYNAVDTRIGAIKSTASALTQAISAMEASWSSDS